MAYLFAVNARRKHHKKRKAGRRKHRSAKQRAATRRMIAARRHHRGSRVTLHKRKGHRRVSMTYSINPRRHRRYRRNPRFSLRGFGGGGIATILKRGVLGGAGGVLADVIMGYTAKILPPSFATPTDTNGNVQYGYFGVKAAVALLIGTQGRRIMPAPIAQNLGEGALTVMAYQFIRPMMPSAIALGYLNPAPTMRPRMAGAGAYVKGVGAYAPTLPVRAASAASPGARAAGVVRLVNNANR